MAKKTPERKCLGCMESFPKSSLIRVVRTPDGEITLDTTGKKSGRGAYICKSSECFKKAVKAKRLERAFECQIPESVIASLEEKIEEEA
jgi:predicted RNA-binding protein YlxR (DUF448 family)